MKIVAIQSPKGKLDGIITPSTKIVKGELELIPICILDVKSLDASINTVIIDVEDVVI